MAKEHHQSVQGAYEAYYGVSDIRRSSAVSATPSASAEQKKQNRLSSTWGSVKQLAREHHRAANSAYLAYYGAAGYAPQTKA
jgi:hypothetical protein